MAGYSNPDCYARSLCDCSGQLSREHYVSASVLKLLGTEHRISQTSWLSAGQQSKPLPVGALGSNILCERHNRSLSDLDSCAATFFAELLQAFSISSGHVAPRKVSVDGDKLEKWVLKAVCGAAASGNLTENGHRIVKEPPRDWLSILFSGADWESETGLHIRQASMTPHPGYSIGPVYDVDKMWAGGGIEFAGVELFVLLDSQTDKRIVEQSTNQVSHLIYRPGTIRVESSMQTTEIELQWRTWIPTKNVLYQIA